MYDIIFKGKTLYSNQFNDIYYNPNEGLEESSYVFIKGCNMDQEILFKKNIIVAETGFGTGLNLIAILKLINEQQITNTKIKFFSIEKYPLKKNIITKIAKFFQDEKIFFKILLKNYPTNINKNISLTLQQNIEVNILIGDIKDKLKELPYNINYWFLDGFSPSKNKEMWCNELFQTIKEKSIIGTKLATFSSSRIVKDGLKSANFSYKLCKGFQNKRNMIKGEKITDT